MTPSIVNPTTTEDVINFGKKQIAYYQHVLDTPYLNEGKSEKEIAALVAEIAEEKKFLLKNFGVTV
jgi:hypothetical protein